MFESIAFTFGLLTSFVLSGASLNNRLKRPHQPILLYIGYLCCGVCAALSAALFLYVARSYLAV